MAAHSSYSSCEQYRENVLDARASLRERGLADIDITYVPGWHAHEAFIDATAANVGDARARLPAHLQASARVIFTAHSIPTRMAARSRYQEQLLESSREVARALGLDDWVVVYQSRSGSPRDPWLEPDINDYLRAAKEEGVEAVVVCPIGFLCDHIEVLYDLDHEAAGVAAELGIAFARAAAVNDHPRFLDMMADVVLSTVRRHRTGRPLELLHAR
jgi:ferrochelatase